MKKLRALLLLVGLAVVYAPQSFATVMFTLTEASDGSVDMNIEATGIVEATSDTWLLIGDPLADSFIASETSGIIGDAPVPGLTLGGVTAQNHFYRDDNNVAGFNGVQSLLGFYFGFGALNGDLDLSDLNGDYNLAGSFFSDFIIGTYTNLSEGINSGTLQGLGDITVIVGPGTPSSVPAPASLVLLSLGLIGIGFSRRIMN